MLFVESFLECEQRHFLFQWQRFNDVIDIRLLLLAVLHYFGGFIRIIYNIFNFILLTHPMHIKYCQSFNIKESRIHTNY